MPFERPLKTCQIGFAQPLLARSVQNVDPGILSCQKVRYRPRTVWTVVVNDQHIDGGHMKQFFHNGGMFSRSLYVGMQTKASLMIVWLLDIGLLSKAGALFNTERKKSPPSKKPTRNHV